MVKNLIHFNFQIVYKPGAINMRPNALNRFVENNLVLKENNKLITRRKPFLLLIVLRKMLFGTHLAK